MHSPKIILISLCFLSALFYSNATEPTSEATTPSSAKADPLELSPIVRTPHGPIQGKLSNFRRNYVYKFTGIPFALPPTGERRFKNPEPIAPWKDVFQATEPAMACMQEHLKVPSFDEDCLQLNIYAPKYVIDIPGAHKLPVMVWIYGGGFAHGSSSIENYEGTLFTAYSNVILVSINYRVSSFGFLRHGSILGNFAFHDQVLALKWIQKNIASFGGDPKSVTIFGHSAGSMSVSALLVSPLARGLFKRAIMQSGSAYMLFPEDTVKVRISSSLLV